MNFDNAAQLQGEIFRRIFDFVEAPAGAVPRAAGLGTPYFVNRAVLERDLVFTDTHAVTRDAQLATFAGPAGRAIASTTRAAGRFEKADTDDIAVGIGAPAHSRENGDFRLVAIYQNRKLKNARILADIESRAPGEIDIYYGGRARARVPWHREPNDPICLGSSIGHFRVTAGTLGCFASDRQSGQIGILSNNHILANVNNASIGDEIRHPGRHDGGTSADRIASLDRFVPIQFGGVPNPVDCGWASLDAGAPTENRRDRFDSANNAVGTLQSNVPGNALPGDLVLKVGRTTGYTQGRVSAVNVNNLVVDMGGGANARFDGQIQIESISRVPFSRGGDSGSLIVNLASQPAALLFAGSDSGGFDNMGLTWANPIATVLIQLDVDIAI